MEKKKWNERCPLQRECERKCQYQFRELECDYYANNGIGEDRTIPDQEELRRQRERESPYDALEKEDFDCEDDEEETDIIDQSAEPGKLVFLPVDWLYPHPDNPRKDIGDLTELAESIKANGVLQNLTVVPNMVVGEITGQTWQRGYRVIIGHRRLAAAKLAGVKELPCIIAQMSERDQLHTMLTENMQRTDLTVYEQAMGFQMMLDLGDTVEDIAEKSGFSKTTVRRRLKIAELDRKTLKQVSEKQLSMADFDKLAKVEDIGTRNKLLRDIGTFNFDGAVTRAIREEHRKKVLPEAKKQIRELGLKPLADTDRYSGKYENYKTVNLDSWEPGEGLGIRETDGIFYHIDHWGSLSIYRKKKRAAAEKKSGEQIAREKEMEEANAALREETAVAFALRRQFIQSLSVTPKTAPLLLRGAVIGITASTVLYKGMDRSALLKLLGIDPDGKWDEVRAGAIRAITTRQDDTLTPEIVYAAFGDSKTNGYHTSYKAQWPEYEKNLALDALYAWLTTMGYEMSDSEKALQQGTHELLRKGKEEAGC